MDCSPPGLSVPGILQARLQERVAISFCRGSSWPRNWTCVSCIAGAFFTTSSVAQSCPTLCDPNNHSTSGLPVHHQLPEFTHSHVHRVGDAIHHLILCHPLLLLPSILLSIRVFANESAHTWGGQRIGVSALASVLPMNTQDWFPLGWTGWTSLQSKELSRVFSNTTVQKH